MNGSCNNVIDSFEEGVEFSVRRLSEPEEWIPLLFINRDTNTKETQRHKDIMLGKPGPKFSLRGYRVEQVFVGNERQALEKISISGVEINDSVQFRWLQTCQIGKKKFSDAWLLDNIKIVQVFSNQSSLPVLCETFSEDTLE